jgi:hypothetical protein
VDMTGNVRRGLQLLRARSGEIPRLMEIELLEPWPIRRPMWFPTWARANCSRLEQRLERRPTSNATTQSPPSSCRLPPPQLDEAVETDRVQTCTAATQTNGDLLLHPTFMLQLLLDQTLRSSESSQVPFVVYMNLRERLIDMEPFVRDLDDPAELLDNSWMRMHTPTLSNSSAPSELSWGHAGASSPTGAQPDAEEPEADQLERGRRAPPEGWGSWRNE